MFYQVKTGDTLNAIAASYYGDSSKASWIASQNQLANANQIYPGQQLELPDLAATETTLVSPALLSALCPTLSSSDLHNFCTALDLDLPKAQITPPLCVAHFMAQTAHESAGFSQLRENLNYSASALTSLFAKYFVGVDVNEYARQPEKIANLVYANRMGNGDEQSGDGWAYRGRGIIQLTGKANYQAFSQDWGVDVVSQPDLVATDPVLAVASGCWYWQKHNINAAAQKDDLTKVTKLINGGTNGIEDRAHLLGIAKQQMGLN
ncbi:MAG: LysM peptidoglycan-binding domain-containing protein [Gammaproteobacteria bacterium]|nr:LysM peptidoglycan-binding domain-containing protein [Gammaproteobacteria bacterium]MBU2056114.1 LysM peptidoglycan-binding domain-containing protein [Gammaproteobacteria bacterium]MBU2175700.1 LysM peptidoglycan-binding domain-containing protein [Gammaproteobacteria bacterium]MBU2245407.1 LysM peptidoglycan-binding domain-containing protein [Gammaproteobacteria bacterium]MBU2344692.1 LysM peptidoglycan-binding domain-containing protein [Gammaproteobacteria bacterium]